ncbi:MAG: hypothetical protein V3U92_07500 [Cellulophaga sp.]
MPTTVDKLHTSHLFEKRFAKSQAVRVFLGAKTGKWKSIVLTPAEHLKFTNAWQKAVGHGTTKGTSGFYSSNVTVEAMKTAARKIYKDYPEILKALGL